MIGPDTAPPARSASLATYHADIGSRHIVAHAVDSAIELRDEPAEGNGEVYVIEAGLETTGEIDALVADYVGHAHRLGFVPMVSPGW